MLAASTLLWATCAAADTHQSTAESITAFLSQKSRSTPTVEFRRTAGAVDFTIHGAFRVDAATGDRGEAARAFLDDEGLGRELGLPGQCRVDDVADNDSSVTVVRIGLYDGDARIDEAALVVHIRGNEITYVGGGFPLRATRSARTTRPVISTEQVRSIVLDRLNQKGWTPESKMTRHFQAAFFNGKPFDPVTQFKIVLTKPKEGPELVYDVNTTGAGWGFWVDAHTGEIVREDPPYRPDMGVGIQ